MEILSDATAEEEREKMQESPSCFREGWGQMKGRGQTDGRTCSGKGPGGSTVALVQRLVDLPGPLLSGVEVQRQLVLVWIHVHLH